MASLADLEALWTRAGGDPHIAPLMAAIADAESSGIPTRVNEHDPNATDPNAKSYGFWQINTANLGPLGLTPVTALDPLLNAKAAVALVGSDPKKGLLNWGTFKEYKAAQFGGPQTPAAQKIAADLKALNVGTAGTTGTALSTDANGTATASLGDVANAAFGKFNPAAYLQKTFPNLTTKEAGIVLALAGGAFVLLLALIFAGSSNTIVPAAAKGTV